MNEAGTVERTEAQIACRVCGQKVDKVYQEETCKPCLTKGFSKHVTMIDQFRNLQG